MQTIGERLEDARKRKGLSIREAAEATKIRGDYLQKFEANQFNIGLTDIYIRGFLRNYANFLQLPADRIVNDYTALGHEPRPRQPSREIYGRMEVSVSSPASRRGGTAAAGPAEADGATGAEPPTPAAPGGTEPAARPSLRPLSTPMPAGRLDPALVFKFLIWGAGAIMLLVIILLVRGLFGGSSSHLAEHPALASAPVAAPAAEADAPVTLVASAPVSIRVTALSDGRELWEGQLSTGDRHDFPNVGLHVSASAIENLEIHYKSAQYRFGAHGQRTGDIAVMH